MIKNAILTQPYETTIGLIHTGKTITIPAGTKLIYASNLPARSHICWWVDELPAELAKDDMVDSWHRCYGIGLGRDAVFLPNYTSEAPQPPDRLD